RIRNLPAGADNRLVAGSSPPSPTTQSDANRRSPVSDEQSQICGRFPRFRYPACVSGASEGRSKAVWRLSSLASGKPFPGAEEGAMIDPMPGTLISRANDEQRVLGGLVGMALSVHNATSRLWRGWGPKVGLSQCRGRYRAERLV